MRNAYVTGSLVPLLLGLACADPPRVTEPPPRLISSQLTPALASRLTADGRFVLPAAVVAPPGEIDEAQAGNLATRYVHGVARSLGGSWSADHGSVVDGNALRPCEHAVYAASPYAEISGAALSEVTIRTFGSHWIVPMCASGQLAVVVSLSSHAVELTSGASDADLALPWSRADVRSFGVPAGAPAALYSPEGAALAAFNLTGKRVASVPELIMNPMPSSPVLVRWRIDLESPVGVRGMRSGKTRAIGAVLAGFAGSWKSSGLLAEDPQGDAPIVNWTDAVTKAPFTVVLSPLATNAVEPVAPVQP